VSMSVFIHLHPIFIGVVKEHYQDCQWSDPTTRFKIQTQNWVNLCTEGERAEDRRGHDREGPAQKRRRSDTPDRSGRRKGPPAPLTYSFRRRVAQKKQQRHDDQTSLALTRGCGRREFKIMRRMYIVVPTPQVCCISIDEVRPQPHPNPAIFASPLPLF